MEKEALVETCAWGNGQSIDCFGTQKSRRNCLGFEEIFRGVRIG